MGSEIVLPERPKPFPADQSKLGNIRIYARGVTERYMDALETKLQAETERADRAERERDAAIKSSIAASRAQGEAEGKLKASEMAGVVEGWMRKTETAERERNEWSREWHQVVSTTCIMLDIAGGLSAQEAMLAIQSALAKTESELTRLREVGRWIATTERLPQCRSHDHASEDCLVLLSKVYHPKVFIGFVKFSDDDPFWIVSGVLDEAEVTHWQPLPPSPPPADGQEVR